MILTICYASSTLIEVFSPENPVVNVNDQKGYYEDVRLNFNEANVKFAFGIYGDQDYLPRTDSRYVKWLASYRLLEEDGTNSEVMLPLTECTQADLDELFPLNEKQ